MVSATDPIESARVDGFAVTLQLRRVRGSWAALGLTSPRFENWRTEHEALTSICRLLQSDDVRIDAVYDLRTEASPATKHSIEAWLRRYFFGSTFSFLGEDAHDVLEDVHLRLMACQYASLAAIGWAMGYAAIDEEGKVEASFSEYYWRRMKGGERFENNPIEMANELDRCLERVPSILWAVARIRMGRPLWDDAS